MLPKLILEGFAVRAACVPVPPSAITRGELVAVELIVMLPVKLPVPVGANPAVKDAVDPARIVCPVLIPLALKPVPAAVMLLIVIVVFPEFVSVIVWVLLLPTTTLPKPRLDELAVSCPEPVLTDSIAGALVTLPSELLTSTLNLDPPSLVVTGGVV